MLSESSGAVDVLRLKVSRRKNRAKRFDGECFLIKHF